MFCKQCQGWSASSRRKFKKTTLKLSLTEGGKEGKSKVTASNIFFESKLLELCKDEGIEIADRVEYSGIDIRNQTNKFGKKKKGKGKVCAENCHHQENS